MAFNLFEYQKEGADFLAGRRRALLLDAPGLGKTAQAIRAADLCGAKSVVTVCPASVTTQWRRNKDEISTGHYRFESCSYESARDKGLPPQSDVLVLDELHYLKNSTSKRTRAILGRARYGTDGSISSATHVWGLSGTPAPKDPTDLYPIMYGIIPGSLLLANGDTMSYWQFVNKFCVTRDNGFGMVVVGTKNLKELAERLSPYVLRRTKKDARKEWVEPVCAELWLGPGAARDMLRKYDESDEGRRAKDAFDKGGLEALQTMEPALATIRMEVGKLKILPVVAWLLEEFDNGLDKVVLMCYHRDVISGIKTALANQGVESVVYWGGLTSVQKDEVVGQFVNNKNVKVFIGQINTSGTGLDGLQAVTGRIVFVEFSYIDDDNQQAISRLDRIGQTEPVLAQFIGLEGSLDGAIMAAASRRAAQNKTLFN